MEVWEKSGDSQNLTSGAATSKDRPASHSGTEPTRLSRFHRALRRYPSSCLFEPTVVFVSRVNPLGSPACKRDSIAIRNSKGRERPESQPIFREGSITIASGVTR
jgi:hypothetical protein